MNIHYLNGDEFKCCNTGLWIPTCVICCRPCWRSYRSMLLVFMTLSLVLRSIHDMAAGRKRKGSCRRSMLAEVVTQTHGWFIEPFRGSVSGGGCVASCMISRACPPASIIKELAMVLLLQEIQSWCMPSGWRWRGDRRRADLDTGQIERKDWRRFTEDTIAQRLPYVFFSIWSVCFLALNLDHCLFVVLII
jgi:hypothetical protein